MLRSSSILFYDFSECDGGERGNVPSTDGSVSAACAISRQRLPVCYDVSGNFSAYELVKEEDQQKKCVGDFHLLFF